MFCTLTCHNEGKELTDIMDKRCKKKPANQLANFYEVC